MPWTCFHPFIAGAAVLPIRVRVLNPLPVRTNMVAAVPRWPSIQYETSSNLPLDDSNGILRKHPAFGLSTAPVTDRLPVRLRLVVTV